MLIAFTRSTTNLDTALDEFHQNLSPEQRVEFESAYQGTILGIRFYYKRFYKERRGCKNPSTEIQYWWMSHALVTPRD